MTAHFTLFSLLTLMTLAPLAALGAQVNVAPYLQIHGQTGPSLSPDGKSVAFSFDGTGVSQVWVEPLAGGPRVQITDDMQRAGFKAWSPVDPNLIIFGRDHGGDENWQFLIATPRGGAPQTLVEQDGVQHNWGGYSLDGKLIAYASNARNREFFDVYTRSSSPVFVASIQAGPLAFCSTHGCSGGPHVVYQADGDNRPLAWSHDGSKLLVTVRTSNFNNDLLLVDLVGQYPHRLLTKHTGDADYESCAFSGDDTRLYCVTDAGKREHRGRAIIDIATGALTYFDTDPGYEIDSLVLSRDGTRMAYVVNRDGYGTLMVREAATDALIATADLPPGVPGTIEFSSKGDQLVFDFSGPTHPDAIWQWHIPANVDAPAAPPRQITSPSLGGVAQSSFVEPTLVRFTSFDGLTIPAWYYKPPGVSGLLPVIVDVHGGPEAQARPVFSSIVQFFVASGYAVLVPNVRGSSGYGNTYLHLADVRKRLDSVNDLHAAHDWLIASGGADPKRIALYGGSYGGYMVLAGLTQFPNDWAAGVDIVGISNFVTFLEHTSPYRRANREAVYGYLQHDRAFLESITPLNHADRIKAPLIIFMGQNDPRVPASEGQQIAQALQARGVPVELTIFPDEGHGIVRDINRITAYTRIAAFLAEHLQTH
ncbi:MAG: S9 family peptidase [Candidatus Eremiobacteraeota bacterium]|nr:S9 family peptidase [Candidatus Eremiobacteraeota bacterium]